MYIVIAGVVLFLLFTAVILAGQNKRLRALRLAEEQDNRLSAMKYSVYRRAFAPQEELPEAAPLFQFTILTEVDEELREGESGETLALCRVPAGSGEFALHGAETQMIRQIRKASIAGARVVPQSFAYHAAYKGEKELIKSLESVIKEESQYAHHR